MVHIPPPSHSANLQIGDYVSKAGIYTRPGVVTEKFEDGQVTIDTDPAAIAKYHRYSNTSGLTVEEKEQFNSIMDEVMSYDSNTDRINDLQEKIDALHSDPKGKRVAENLRNEQAQLIRMSKELPRVYNFDGNKIR